MKNQASLVVVEVQALKPGMFVHIDLGWMDHPFPLNKFRVASQDQIGVIRSLGLQQVKVDKDRSDPGVFDTLAPAASALSEQELATQQAAAQAAAEAARARRELLDRQHESLAHCDRQFADAAREWRLASSAIAKDPQQAREKCVAMVDGFLGAMAGESDTHIRLLSESAGDSAAFHALNVTVISLLLGKALGFDAGMLKDLGLGALLHDVGKLSLPERLRVRSAFKLSPVEERAYREHSALGVTLGKTMGLSMGALAVIAQHHEHADGSGYPTQFTGDRMTPAARVVSLVNIYDNLSNPGNPALAMTPHEALSVLFAQRKQQFDPATLAMFLRLMGVYPPGSVVQLSDDRFAMVVAVNASRPLKPRVVVHDAGVPKEDALVLDLQDEPSLSIRRSLHGRHLPRATLDYLSPRQRVCYFFERASGVGEGGASAGAVGVPA